MIKYFKALGIKGIPDIEIDFKERNKYIIVKGPNGSGKTTLLNHITNPFANAQGPETLKKGVSEGYKEYIIEYKDNTYRINHVFKKKGKNLVTNSYIAKQEGEDFVELCVNGLVNNFKDIVIRELEYQDFFPDILNIGVENHGLVVMSDSYRLEYLKKIYNETNLTTMRDNANKHYTFVNSKVKIEKDKLTQYDQLEDYNKQTEKMNRHKHDLATKIHNYRNELSELEHKYTNEYFNELEKECLDIKNKVKQIEVINKYLQDGDSFDTIFENINISGNQTKFKIDSLNENLIEVKTDLSRLKQELKVSDQESQLEEAIIKINKTWEDVTKYNDLPDIDRHDVEKVIDEICDLDEKQSKFRLSDSDIYQAITKYKTYDNVIEEYNKKLKERELNNKLILKNEEEQESINVNSNILELDPHEKCKFNTCPLFKEHKRQVDLTNKSIELNKEHHKLKELEVSLNDDINDLEQDKIILSNFDYKGSKAYDYISENTPIEKVINFSSLEILRAKAADLRFYLLDKERKKELENELQLIHAKENKNIILENIKKLEEKEKNIKEERDKFEKNLLKIKARYNELIVCRDFDKYLLSYTKEKLNKTLTEYRNTLDKKENEKEKYRLALNNLNNTKELLKDSEIKQNEIIESLKEIEYKVRTVKELQIEFEKATKELEGLKILRKIVNTELPALILQDMYNEVSGNVNRLLNGFLSMTFEKNDSGVNILCDTTKGTTYSNKLSQGQKAILSIALLFALKKYISWDIISIDEGSATFDEENKSRFLNMVETYSNTVENLSQIFVVTHDNTFDSLDTMVIDLSCYSYIL